MIEMESPPAMSINPPPAEIFPLGERFEEVENYFGHLPKIEPNRVYNPLTANYSDYDFKKIQILDRAPSTTSVKEIMQQQDNCPAGVSLHHPDEDRSFVDIKLKEKDWGVKDYGAICDDLALNRPYSDFRDSCSRFFRKMNVSDPQTEKWAPLSGTVKRIRVKTELNDNGSVTVDIPSVSRTGVVYPVKFSEIVEDFCDAAEYHKSMDLEDVWVNAKICVPLGLGALGIAFLMYQLRRFANKT